MSTKITSEDYDLGWTDCRKREVEPLQAQRDALLAAAKDALDAMLIPGVQIATHHWNYLRETLRQAIANCEKA